MKPKPIFKNTTKSRIQIIQRGIPIWLNPGDVIVGEKYRVFTRMGLQEVPKEQFPKVVNDDNPEKSPVKVRKMVIVDHILPTDHLKISSGVEAKIELTTAPDEDEVTTKKKPDKSSEMGQSEEPVLGIQLAGDALLDHIVDEIGDELESSQPSDIEPVIDDKQEEQEVDNYPFKCEQAGCDKAFASKRGLKSHLRVHK